MKENWDICDKVSLVAAERLLCTYVHCSSGYLITNWIGLDLFLPKPTFIPYLAEELHREDVGEMSALVIRGEGDRNVFSFVRLNGALYRRRAEYAATIVILRSLESLGRGIISRTTINES